MNRYISTILLLLALLCVGEVSAQGSTKVAEKKFNWGVKAGMNIGSAGLYGDDTEGRNEYRRPRFGGVAGISAEYKFNSDISLSADLLYSQQGVKYKYDAMESVSGESCMVTHRFDYLNLPIIFNYYFYKEYRLSMSIGIQPGYMLKESSSSKITSGSSSRTLDYAYGWEGGYYKFDLTLPIGLSWGVTDNVYLDLRYSIGLVNVFDDNAYDDDYSRDLKSKNNTFSLMIGFKF